MRAILFVKSAEPQVPVSLKAMVELDPGSEGGEQGTWDAAERVEEAIVNCIDRRLMLSVCIASMQGDPLST